MDITTYISKLKELVEALQKSKDKQLLYCSFGEPASNEQIEIIKAKFFFGRDSSVLELYRKVNGFQIIWNYTNHSTDNVAMNPLIFLKRNIKFDGVINFLPLETAFNSEVWKGVVWFEDDTRNRVSFAGEELSNDVIKKRLIPLDFFSVDMSMGMFVNRNTEYLLLLQDYHISYEDSSTTDFEGYLNFILATEGLSSAKYTAFNKLNGYKDAVLTGENLLEKLNA